jgi:hypothetical protein
MRPRASATLMLQRLKSRTARLHSAAFRSRTCSVARVRAARRPARSWPVSSLNRRSPSEKWKK